MAVVSCLSCYIILFFHWRVWYTRLNRSEFVEASESNTTIQDTMEEYKNVER